MKYKRFYIKNYKGIKEVDLDLSQIRILTLVGLNESGKTTILEAIELFYRLIRSFEIDENELQKIRPKSISFSDKIEMTVDLEFEEEDKVKLANYTSEDLEKTGKYEFPDFFSYTFEFQYEKSQYIETKRTCTFQAKSIKAKKNLFATDRDLWQNLIDYTKEFLVPEILLYEDFIFQIPDSITYELEQLTPQEKQQLPKEYFSDANQEWQNVLDDITKAVHPDFTSFKEDVVDIWISDRDSADQRINGLKHQLDNKITNSWQQLFDSGFEEGETKRLNFKEIILKPDEKGKLLHISFKIKTDSGKEYSINERSKGCKWFFSFLIFTEFRKNRTNNILFLLDEPASNLHSSAQQKILDAINNITDKAMMVYSTHSHHLINPNWLNGAYVVINEGITSANLSGAFTLNDANIEVKKYYNYVGTKSSLNKSIFFQPILDRLDYTRSLLEATPKITICEGKFDWYTFKYMAFILKDKYSYNFYPGGGKDTHWEIIRLYMSWGSDFILLLDGDDPGVESANNYKKEFKPMLDEKIFTLHDILEINDATEALFTEADYKEIINAAFGENVFQQLDKKEFKSKFNYGINQLLIQNKTVKISTEAKNNFKKLFKFIRSYS